MNKKIFTPLLLILAFSGCTQSLAESTPQTPSVTETPTLFIGSPLPTLETPMAGETAVPVPLPSFTPLSQPTPDGISSNQYAVINVLPDDVLNIRSGPGVQNPVAGTLQHDQSGLTRTGKSSSVGEDTWVEIQNPGGGTGWVNADFLTEFVAPASFCADARVNTLIENLESAVLASNDDILASLIHSLHGLDVRLWRYGTVANYTLEEASWVLESEYEVNWGPAPGSGENTLGTFSEAILPRLQEVFSAIYNLHCNDTLDLSTFSLEPWPPEYANINFYTVYKPGTEQYGGLDWRAWTVGVEYVGGEPYLFSLIHYQWEP
ncbi:MAG: SH3 domain-containing protein [Anaerolineales bacterium]